MVQLNHVASVAHRVATSHARPARNNNDKTHAARVSIWAKTNAMTSTIVSPPAMCRQAFHHQACQRAALVVAEVAIVEVAAAVAAHVQVGALEAVVILAAGSGANRLVASITIKKQLQAAFFLFYLIFRPIEQ